MSGSTNDVLWKGILEELFGDFLLFIFPRSDHILNIKRGFESMDKEFVEIKRAPERSNLRIVDKLVKVHQKMAGGHGIYAT